ncbi:complement C3 [Trichonephila clavipes]|nr:complement C3 [Trichonephila clavipes]
MRRPMPMEGCSNAADIFKVHVRSEDFPPGFLSTPGEKSVLLTVHSDNFHKEIPIPVSIKTGYVFIQTDKPIYTPNQIAYIRIIPLNEDALPSDKPIKLQIKNPNGTTVEETTFTKGEFSKFQTAFVLHTYKFPKFVLIGKWTATVNYGYRFKQSTTVPFELQEYVSKFFLWSDSSIALYWNKGKASNYKQFVSNRVIEIQSNSDPSDWHHCSGRENPADYVSRGANLETIINSFARRKTTGLKT